MKGILIYRKEWCMLRVVLCMTFKFSWKLQNNQGLNWTHKKNIFEENDLPFRHKAFS